MCESGETATAPGTRQIASEVAKNLGSPQPIKVRASRKRETSMNAQSIPVAGKSFLKLSTDGPDGSGKTCTMAQLAVGLAKEFADGGAVLVFDSSDRWSAWKVHIFDVEKIPLVITVGNSLAALQESMDHFLDEGGAVYVADDLTVPWMEGLASFAYENGNLPFDRRQQLVGHVL